MEKVIPSLEAILQSVEKFVTEGAVHADTPHMILMTLPMLCSYLPFWWNHGPDNVNPTNG